MAERQGWVHIIGSLIKSNNLVPTVFLNYGSFFEVLQGQSSVPCYIRWAFVSIHVKLFTENAYNFLSMLILPLAMWACLTGAKERLEVSELSVSANVRWELGDYSFLLLYLSVGIKP